MGIPGDVPASTTPSQSLEAEPAFPSSIQPLELEEAEDRPTRTKLRLYAILVALYLSVFIAALDNTIIATAIPTIAAQLHSGSGYAWIASAYFLANAAAGPVWAKLSDIWGRKPALLASVTFFAASSIIAALSINARMLISARALQGTAAAGLVQLALITICDLFSPRERTVFLGGVNVVWGIAGGIGPLIGGAFTQYVSWRWCFWINLPVCGTSFILLLILLDVHNPRTNLRDGLVAFDWLGTLSIIGVTLLLLMGLDFGGVTFPWDSPTVICLLIFGIFMIGIFLFTEKSIARYPLMPLQIFRNWSTNAVFLVCFAHGIAFIGADFYLPLYFQSALALSPLRSGLLMLPYVLPEASMGLLNGFMMLKTGRYREAIWFGLVFLTLGLSLMVLFDATTSVAMLAGIEIIAGIGSGFLFEAPMIALQAVTPQETTAAATAAFGFARNMATTFSIVLGSVVFQNSIETQGGKLQAAGLNSTLVEDFTGGTAQANVELVKGIADAGQMMAVREVFAWSMRNLWIMYACIAGVGLLGSVFIKHVDLKTEHTETRTGIDIKERGNDR